MKDDLKKLSQFVTPLEWAQFEDSDSKWYSMGGNRPYSITRYGQDTYGWVSEFARVSGLECSELAAKQAAQADNINCVLSFLTPDAMDALRALADQTKENE